MSLHSAKQCDSQLLKDERKNLDDDQEVEVVRGH